MRPVKSWALTSHEWPCDACGELHDSATEMLLHDGKLCCIECWRELAHGIIPPAYGPLEHESPWDLWLDDDLERQGRHHNAIKAMEDTR